MIWQCTSLSPRIVRARNRPTGPIATDLAAAACTQPRRETCAGSVGKTSFADTACAAEDQRAWNVRLSAPTRHSASRRCLLAQRAAGDPGELPQLRELTRRRQDDFVRSTLLGALRRPHILYAACASPQTARRRHAADDVEIGSPPRRGDSRPRVDTPPVRW